MSIAFLLGAHDERCLVYKVILKEKATWLSVNQKQISE
jgi:hypothetical protein